jgi:hypothetical protein
MVVGTRTVPLPRLSAALYLLMAIVMAGAVVLCMHGGLRTIERAERALQLRAVTADLTELSVAVAKGERQLQSLTATLEDWLLATAPQPAAAEAALAKARAQGAEGNPRLVARQAGDFFDASDLSGSLLQAHLFLVMREDLERGIETILNALASRYGVEIERRRMGEAVKVWLASEAAPDIEAAVRRIPEAETRLDILARAGLALSLLAGLGVGAVFYAARFFGDARRLVRYGRL